MTAKDFRDTADAFTKGYLTAALWTLPDEDYYNEVDIESCAPETLDRVVANCKAFQEAMSAHIVEDNLLRSPDNDWRGTFGHDFWLTRNGHGAGYWDGDYAEPAATELTKAAKAAGECWLYVEPGTDEGEWVVYAN